MGVLIELGIEVSLMFIVGSEVIVGVGDMHGSLAIDAISVMTTLSLGYKSITLVGCGTKFLYSLHSKNENTQTLFFARFYFNI
jgi:hypothetical protein